LRLAKQSPFNSYLEKFGEYGELLIMPSNGRWEFKG
jgi:hypothetical protein